MLKDKLKSESKRMKGWLRCKRNNDQVYTQTFTTVQE